MENAIITSVGLMCFIGILCIADAVHAVWTRLHQRKARLPVRLYQGKL